MHPVLKSIPKAMPLREMRNWYKWWTVGNPYSMTVHDNTFSCATIRCTEESEIEVIGRRFSGEDKAEKINFKILRYFYPFEVHSEIDAMSEKSGRNKKRSKPTSTLKMKIHKASDWVSNEEISEENNCPKDIMKLKKLVTASQPILRNDQKIKLKALLSNWKPPLKNKHNENHEVCNMKTDTVQESEMKVLKSEDNVCETKQIQKISPSNSAELKLDTQVESSFGNDNYHVNNTLVHKSSQQHQESYNVHEPSTSLNQDSESTIYDTHMTNANFDFNEQKSKDIFAHDINSREVIIKNKNCDSKFQENSLNEQVNIPCPKTGTPEVTRTPPPTSPTLKISYLNSNVGNDLSPSNSKNLIPNETYEEPLNLNKKSPKESNTYNKTELLIFENEKVNSSELLTVPMKSELQTLTKSPIANSFKTECELDLSILHSQHDSLENNQSTSATQRELPQELNASRELAQDLNPREWTQDIKNIDFTPFHPTAFTPKMPRIKWVHQLQEDKRKLQVVVKEISQLNAMLTRAIREIWPARPPH